MSGSLAQRQAELVRSLVGGTPDPRGFVEPHLAAARRALLRKRADDVARVWPHLAASHGTLWRTRFGAWAAGRPPQGSLHDGLGFARAHPPEGLAGIELMVHEVRLRRWPTLRVGHGAVVVQFAGRVLVRALPRRA